MCFFSDKGGVLSAHRRIAIPCWRLGESPHTSDDSIRKHCRHNSDCSLSLGSVAGRREAQPITSGCNTTTYYVGLRYVIQVKP